MIIKSNVVLAPGTNGADFPIPAGALAFTVSVSPAAAQTAGDADRTQVWIKFYRESYPLERAAGAPVPGPIGWWDTLCDAAPIGGWVPVPGAARTVLLADGTEAGMDTIDAGCITWLCDDAA